VLVRLFWSHKYATHGEGYYQKLSSPSLQSETPEMHELHRIYQPCSPRTNKTSRANAYGKASVEGPFFCWSRKQKKMGQFPQNPLLQFPRVHYLPSQKCLSHSAIILTLICHPHHFLHPDYFGNDQNTEPIRPGSESELIEVLTNSSGHLHI
jgi:hypothetical protein